MEDRSKLIAIKLIHTVVWAIFAASISAIPVFVSIGKLVVAWYLVAFVFFEVVVLLMNRMRCPLTDIAGRYTGARSDNFDIYLPLWLARNNKLIFGVLYIGGFIYLVWVQVGAMSGA